MAKTNVIQLLRRREYGRCGTDRKNDDLLGKHSMEIGLNELKCGVGDVYPCTKMCENDYEETDVPPFVSKFAKANEFRHILAVASEEGEIFVLNSNLCGGENLLSVFRAHDNAIFDVCWVNAAPKLVTGSGDSTAVLWDMTTCKKITSFLGHTASVKSVSFRPEDQSVFATGSRDGNIFIWDYRMNGCEGQQSCVDNKLRNVHQLPIATNGTSRQKKNLKLSPSDRYQSVTVVLFQDEYNLISAGVGDGLIKIWDLRKTYCRFKNDPLPKTTLPYAGKSVKDLGYSSLDLDSSGFRLFANCTDNIIYEYNCTTFNPQPVATYSGHQNSTYFVKSKLSPDDNYLLSGSSDGNAYIWKVGFSSKPLFKLSGHSAEVTSVDWCLSNEPKIVTCSDDMRYRIWRMQPHAEMDYSGNEKLERVDGLSDTDNLCRPLNSRSIASSPCTSMASVTSPLREIQISHIENVHGTLTSPTQNLPNTVLDQLHTPDSCDTLSIKKQHRPRKVNWLTEHAMNCTAHKQANRNSTSDRKRKRLIKSRSENTGINKCLEKFFK